MDALISISRLYADIVESTTLSLLFHNLPDRAPPVSATTERDQYRRILASLVKTCTLPSFFETLLIRIITKLELLASATFNSEADADVLMNGEDQVDPRECNIAYAYELLDCLVQVVNAKLAAKHADVARYFDKIIPHLHGLVVAAAVPKFGYVQPLFRDRRLLAIIAELTETLMWELSAESVWLRVLARSQLIVRSDGKGSCSQMRTQHSSGVTWPRYVMKYRRRRATLDRHCG